MDVQVWAADRSYASVQLAEGQGCVTRVRPSARRTSSIVRCLDPESAEMPVGSHWRECEDDVARFVVEVRSLSCISLLRLVVEFNDICSAVALPSC